MTYTIEQIAKAVGISSRSIYVYAERRLIPPPLKEGRRFLYTEEHLEALRLVRVLLRLGLPTRQIEQLVAGREQGEVRRALAPVLPLSKLLSEAEARVEGLQRKVRAPATAELDLGDLGLEDPVWLRHELVGAEHQRDRVQEEFDRAGAAVLRELVGPFAMSPRSSVGMDLGAPLVATSEVRSHLDAISTDLVARLDHLQSVVSMNRADAECEAFVAGLAAARAGGWQPDAAAPPPTALRPELANAFRAFVDAATTANGVSHGNGSNDLQAVMSQ